MTGDRNKCLRDLCGGVFAFLLGIALAAAVTWAAKAPGDDNPATATEIEGVTITATQADANACRGCACDH